MYSNTAADHLFRPIDLSSQIPHLILPSCVHVNCAICGPYLLFILITLKLFQFVITQLMHVIDAQLRLHVSESHTVCVKYFTCRFQVSVSYGHVHCSANQNADGVVLWIQYGFIIGWTTKQNKKSSS